MAYSREEQETTLVFEAATNAWKVYSTVPKHMRKLAELTELNVLETEADGTTPKAVSGVLSDKQVSMKKARVMTEEQRQAAADRLRKLREESAK
ncbi:hypothetical protein [Cytobacillus gottheilii]|uniref:Uncharacterized protein n=1 Tax=Cytobacillus gottheilii TaxID=859144 RepID=A0ABX8FG10_9BACI|nr:hypothetical protein [Cytobacillus gottheilii]QVY62937.1 hypothetical protein J1899_07805 [Cytobacillus gottheilii]